jgi:hypothetical protein
MMFASLLLTIAVLFALIAGWVLVQAAARRVAERRPELGPYREAGGGCGGGQCDGHGGCGGGGGCGHG